MSAPRATHQVDLGFMPLEFAVPDPQRPGLRRAGERASAPYSGDAIEVHGCSAVDLSTAPDAADLFGSGFDVVDLSGLDSLQGVLAQIRSAGVIEDDDAANVRAGLDGAVLPTSSGRTLTVLHVADEGLILRKAGPNRLSVVAPESHGMNDHGPAQSVHADQDVFGTPLTQLMDGRAPELFRHDSPDGSNTAASLMLINLWIPLQQITQPLVLADGGSLDRRAHQLRYGLRTEGFLERDEDLAINDIWTFLHHADQRWYFRAEMDHREAYAFNTLSTAHGAATVDGESTAEEWWRALCAAEEASSVGDSAGLADALEAVVSPDVKVDTTPALAAAIEAMTELAEEASADPSAILGSSGTEWRARSAAARQALVRMSLEMRLVVSVT